MSQSSAYRCQVDTFVKNMHPHFLFLLEGDKYLMMGSSSSLPANDSYIKTTPYPSQGKEQPFMYQQNYGSLIRKNLVERSRTYIDDKTESQHSDYGLKDLEITEMKDGS